jgi:hypothetical protein
MPRDRALPLARSLAGLAGLAGVTQPGQNAN